MNIGITGGAGFIGRALVPHLAARARAPLRVLVRTPNPSAFADSTVAQVELCRGDLMSSIDCERFVAGLSVIFFLAHRNTPATSDLDLPNDALANCVPLLNLIQAVREAGTKPHVVYFSTGGAMYAPRPDHRPYVETDLCRPFCSYGIQKLMGEQYLRVAAERGHVTATILRVGNAYGALLEPERLQGLIGVALNNVIQGKPVAIFGNPANVRDYVHLDDICRVAEKVLAPLEPFSVFNVGTQTGYSVTQVLDTIERCVGTHVVRDTSHSVQISGWLPEWCVLDITRARTALGWEPRLSLYEGIETMLRCGAQSTA